MEPNTNQSTQDWDARELIDSVCDDFRQALSNALETNIESLLTSVPASVRPKLLKELVGIELQYRRERGETPRLQEFLDRFPEHATWLKQQFPSLVDTDRVGQATPRNAASCQITLQVPVQGFDSETPVSGSESWIANRYRLLTRLGRGGFGEVWSARDELLHREVAIKFLNAERELSETSTTLLLEEGRRLAQLDHEHIVRVIDAGCLSDRFFLISEFMAGGTLEQRLRERNVPIADAVRWTATLARALHHAHSAGIVHRDIKPSNILFDAAGEPHLADFGLAISEEELIGELPQTLGSVHYMPPEQAQGNSHLVDPRSDVYSLGVVLYRLLTNRLPFAAKSAEDYKRELLTREPRPLRVIDSRIPQPLESLCMKCLHKSIAQRPATALELAEELERWLKTSTTPPSKSHTRSWITALGGAAIVLFGLWWVTRQRPADIDRAQKPAAVPEFANPNTSQFLLRPVQKPAAVPEFANPELIAWNPYDIYDSYGYDPTRDRFRFDAFDHAVFRVGTHEPNKPLTLRLDYGVDRWEGWAGVVWNLVRLPGERFRCWHVRAGRYRNNDRFQVIIGEFEMGPLGAGRIAALKTKHIAEIPVELPAGRRAQLRVKAGQQTVEQIWLNDAELLKAPVALPDAA